VDWVKKKKQISNFPLHPPIIHLKSNFDFVALKLKNKRNKGTLEREEGE
jgi:hypothetical protein